MQDLTYRQAARPDDERFTRCRRALCGRPGRRGRVMRRSSMATGVARTLRGPMLAIVGLAALVLISGCIQPAAVPAATALPEPAVASSPQAAATATIEPAPAAVATTQPAATPAATRAATATLAPTVAVRYAAGHGAAGGRQSGIRDRDRAPRRSRRWPCRRRASGYPRPHLRPGCRHGDAGGRSSGVHDHAYGRDARHGDAGGRSSGVHDRGVQRAVP